jgi:hypothetical protein
VPIDHHRSGAPRGHGGRWLSGHQSGQLGVRISGHQQSRIGAWRQAKAVFNLLNCAFVRLTGTAFQKAQSHDADPGGGGKVS